MTYAKVIARDHTTDGAPCYTGWVLELPGCMGMGATVEECRADLLSAEADYIADMVADGLPLPPPINFLAQPVVIDLSRVSL